MLRNEHICISFGHFFVVYQSTAKKVYFFSKSCIFFREVPFLTSRAFVVKVVPPSMKRGINTNLITHHHIHTQQNKTDTRLRGVASRPSRGRCSRVMSTTNAMAKPPTTSSTIDESSFLDEPVGQKKRKKARKREYLRCKCGKRARKNGVCYDVKCGGEGGWYARRRGVTDRRGKTASVTTPRHTLPSRKQGLASHGFTLASA